MINKNSLEAVRKSIFEKGLRKPLYDSYSFSKIPDTIKKILAVPSSNSLPEDCTPKKEYDDVILFFIDGFGWVFYEKNRNSHPFLVRFQEKGIESMLTSQFPSTTACHVTTINTALPVSETGIYEWFYYEPQVDNIICPFLFCFAGDKKAGSLQKMRVSPEEIFPFTTFYEELKKEGIESFVFQNEHIVDSLYSQTLLKGSTVTSFSSFEEALSKLEKSLLTPSTTKRYFFVYIDDIDSAGHRSGIGSPEFQNALDNIFTNLESWHARLEGKLTRKTLCLCTADHGMIEIDPKTTVYLNEAFPKCKEHMKKNKEGKLLSPSGSSRDFFLHCHPESLDIAEKEIQEFLDGKALVYQTKKLLDAGIFGKDPSSRLLERLGNLVILPQGNNSVWWHEKGRFGQHFYAMHGGLSPQEMETIFLCLELN